MDTHSESKKCLDRIINSSALNDTKISTDKGFNRRLQNHFPELFDCFLEVYGHRYDCHFHIENLLSALSKGYLNRPKRLAKKDAHTDSKSYWHQDKNELGMACYVDLFSGNLKNLVNRIPYLKRLGITYLHLMPLYDSPEGNSDGGYAVSDYRKVDKRLGSIADLEELSISLNKNGIRLVLDFVFNHTSDEHPWIKKAREGHTEYRDYYHVFENREIPDKYEASLKEIFPHIRRGNFTWDEPLERWVWTTFNSFQWDLNYSNPEVFIAVTQEMLFLANLGCDVLRLDALAFIWKQMGTDCENQPKAHTLIKAFNLCLKIVAPSVLFKSEAIVHPDEVNKYVNSEECELSYNPLLMALIWNSLATRKTKLLNKSMQKSFPIPSNCSWVNYVRCHDDIGWTFDDNIAAELGINSMDHRHFLNSFYTGKFNGSFALGVPFGDNPQTGDCRICGTLASLCGLEKAIEQEDNDLINAAIKRIVLVHSIILSIGGIPLLYAGDEMGIINDYRYRLDPEKKDDDRWVHRTPFPTDESAKSQFEIDARYRVYSELEKLIKIRKEHDVFGNSKTEFIESKSPHIFAYMRQSQSGRSLLAVCNFDDYAQHLDESLTCLIQNCNVTELICAKDYYKGDIKQSIGSLEVNWFYW